MPPGVTASVGAGGAIGEVPSAMVCLQTRLGLIRRKYMATLSDLPIEPICSGDSV